MRQRIREFLRIELKKDIAVVSDEESLLEAGILDSLGVLQLVGFLEREVGIRVEDDDLMPENFDSIEAIDSFIVRSTRAHG